ncbi:MAG: universal stress protein [Hormoscilla sp. SP5CHS1]|nr:universal stress protein [Hormoscilla sp. SP12CHS1]MBC6453406.1 universal stress protein [Hormoscilla sp. SP5CHS1]
MFKRALISTDLSDGLHRLVDFVPDLAASGLQQIVFLHTVLLWQEGRIPREDTEKLQSAKSRLSVAQVPSGVDVKVEVFTSNKPHEAILQTAETYQSDIIILGASTQNLLNEKLFGSTSVTVSQQTETPLMVLRPRLVSIYTTEELSLRCQHLFRYLMIPYDGSDSADYLVQQIKQYAQDRPSGLSHCLLIWVVEEGGIRELRKHEELQLARETLASVKADLSQLDLEVIVEMRQGDPLPEIFNAALEHDIAAIAISSLRHNKLLDWSVPSFSNQLLRSSWHPIIFFPPPRCAKNREGRHRG